MNTVELLMGMDYDKIVRIPEMKLKIKRLSEMTGEDFIVTVKAISGRRYMELSGTAMNGTDVDYSKLYDANIRLALAGLEDPDLKDEDVMEHFHAKTPAEALERIFTNSEITQITDAIRELSGFGDAKDAVTQIKN